MSKEEKADSPWWLAGPGGQKPIPVALIRFRTGITVDIPKKPAASAIGDDRFQKDPATGQWIAKPKEQTNRERYRLYLLPWSGFFCVEYYPAGEGATRGAPLMLPREWASWEPAPL